MLQGSFIFFFSHLKHFHQSSFKTPVSGVTFCRVKICPNQKQYLTTALRGNALFIELSRNVNFTDMTRHQSFNFVNISCANCFCQIIVPRQQMVHRAYRLMAMILGSIPDSDIFSLNWFNFIHPSVKIFCY